MTKRLAATVLLVVASAIAWRLSASPEGFVSAVAITYVSAWAAGWLWSSASRRTRTFSTIAVHLALLALLVLLETPAAFGWIDYRLVFRTGHFFFASRDPSYQRDPELGYRAPPGARHQGLTKGNIAVLFQVPDARIYPYDVRYDARGFRNPEAISRADVALVGDSFVHGVFVPQEALVSSVLSRELSTSVYNLAQLGYGPQQESAVVRRFALPLGVRSMVWVFYEGNDLNDVVTFHEFERDAAAAMGRRHDLVARSFTRNSFEALGTLTGKTRASATPRSAVWTKAGSSTRVYFLEPSRPLTDQDEAALGEFQTIFGSVARTCESLGIQLVLAFAPTKFRVLKDQITIASDSELVAWQPSDLPARLDRLSRGWPGVSFLDLTPALVDRATEGELPFFHDDTHWNPAGHDAAGRALATVLKQLRQKKTLSSNP